MPAPLTPLPPPRCIALLLNKNAAGKMIAAHLIPRLYANGMTAAVYFLTPRVPSKALIPSMADFYFYDSWLMAQVIEPYLNNHPAVDDSTGCITTLRHLQARHSFDISDLPSIDGIPDLQPVLENDAIAGAVSVRNQYIFKDEFIQSFTKNRFLWNLHTGLLPEYRGAHALLWAMGNNEQASAWTLHELVRGIDEGDIVGQRHFMLDRNLSYIQTLFAAIPQAAELIADAAHEKINGTANFYQKNLFAAFPYYSYPTDENCLSWYQRGIRIANPAALTRAYVSLFAGDDTPFARGLRDRIIQAVAEWEQHKNTALPENIISAYASRRAA